MQSPAIQFGLETEIGISRDNDENLDVVAESIALVRSITEPGVLMRWDYGSEDPHADMRGFHVEELRQDFDEAQYFAQDVQRELTFAEIAILSSATARDFITIMLIPSIAPQVQHAPRVSRRIEPVSGS
jgi:hypothetical protein